MPAKAHRTASGLTRTHSRTSSTSSSKANLGLQLTQKDPVPPRFTDNKKRNAHVHHEAGGRNTSPFPRNNSTIRVQSKEQLQPAILRRAPTPQVTANKSGSSKQKVGFSISSPSEGDDDEWVSSESGAATPLQDADSDRVTSPIEPHKPSTPRVTSHVNGFGIEPTTPRARTPPLPRVETVRPETSLISSQQQQHHHYQSQDPPQKVTRMLTQEQLGTPWGTQPQLPQQPTPSVPKARSETHSPPRRSPDHTMKRQAMTRPPSTHSIASRSDSAGLRPHPLIRAQSHGLHGLAPAKPMPLAPLTTVLDDLPTQMTTSSSPTSLRAVSPSMSLRTPASPVFSHPSPTSSEARRQLRRTSTSSARSMAALPVAPSASQQLSRSNHDRQRTISTSSTFAALSSLAMRSTPSPPRTPLHQFTVTFPPADKESHHESPHPLLPPPYLTSHLTLLEYRNPLAESYDRVIRAKQAL